MHSCLCTICIPYVCAHRNQKKKLDPLELELQEIVLSHHVALRIEPGTSGRVASVLYC